MKNKTAKILLAALTAASLTSMPVMAADASDYILLLPKTEGVTYEMAQDHVADQYSNDQYTVLLYKEGETVDLTVSGTTDFVIKDAMDSDTTDYAASETDGKVSFTMPAEDLSLSVNNVSEESVAAAKAAAETETETRHNPKQKLHRNWIREEHPRQSHLISGSHPHVSMYVKLRIPTQIRSLSLPQARGYVY